METSIFESNSTVLSNLSSLINCFYKHCTIIRNHLAEIQVQMSLVLAEKFLRCLSRYRNSLFPSSLLLWVVFLWRCCRCSRWHTEEGRKSCEEAPCFSTLRGHALFFLNLSAKWIPTSETYTWVHSLNVCVGLDCSTHTFCLISRKGGDVSGFLTLRIICLW